MSYGEELKYQRQKTKLSQRELAEKIHTSQQNISRWEKDEVAPNITFCIALAEFYDRSMNSSEEKKRNRNQKINLQRMAI